jgi:hypothetical protein
VRDLRRAILTEDLGPVGPRYPSRSFVHDKHGDRLTPVAVIRTSYMGWGAMPLGFPNGKRQSAMATLIG